MLPGSGFFLLAGALGHEQRGAAGSDAFRGDRHLAHVIAARQLEHDLGHHLFEDGAQASRAGAALHRFRSDRLERVLLERLAYVLKVEQLLVLVRERVLGLGEDADQRVFVERIERYGDREAAHQLGDEAIPEQIVGLDIAKRILLDLGGDTLGHLFFCKADLPPAGAGLDDLLEPVERAAADEQNVLGVDLDILLLRMLAPALRGHAGDRALQDLEQRLLYALARDVARDAGVLGFPRDLVDLVDIDDAPLGLGYVEVGSLQQAHEDVLHVLTDVAGFGERGRVGNRERHVQDARQGLRQERFADTRRADQEDVALVEVLPDYVLVQDVFDFRRRGDLGDGFRDLALFVLRQDLIAERNALIADVDRRSGDEFPDRILGFAAERAAEVLVVRHRT